MKEWMIKKSRVSGSLLQSIPDAFNHDRHSTVSLKGQLDISPAGRKGGHENEAV